MNTGQSLLTNSVFALVAELAEKSAGAILFWIISWAYGPQQAGIYALAVSYMYVASRFSFFGLEQLLTRNVARQRDLVARYFVNLSLLRVLLAAGGELAIWGVLRLVFDYSPTTQSVILLIGLISFTENITFLCRAVFAAFEQIQYQTLAGSVSGMVKIAAGVVALAFSADLQTLAVVLVVANLLGAGIYVYLVWARFLTGHAAGIDLGFCWRQLKHALPFAFIDVSSILDAQLSPILLSWFCTETQIGLYGAAATIVNALNLFPQAYRVAIFPVMSRFFVQDAARLTNLYTRSFKSVLLLALPVAAGGMVLSGRIIGLLYKPEFAPAASVLPILLGSWLLLSLNVVNNRLLIAADRQRWTAVALTLGLAINLGGNILWTRQFDIVGAAAARLVASACMVVSVMIGIRRYVCSLPHPLFWVKPTVAAAVMAVVVGALGRFTPLHLVLLIPAGMLSYLGMLLVVRALDDQDLEILNRLRLQIGNRANLTNRSRRL